MPQLDPSSFASQLFWLTISFVVLYVLLASLLLPKVQSVLVMRKRTMESDVEQADRLKSQAARVSEQYDSAMAEAKAKSQEMFLKAQAEIAARTSKRRTELDAELEKKLAHSDETIRSAKQAVSGKLSPVAGELASLIVEVLVHEKPDAKATQNAINESAKAMSESAKDRAA